LDFQNVREEGETEKAFIMSVGGKKAREEGREGRLKRSLIHDCRCPYNQKEKGWDNNEEKTSFFRSTERAPFKQEVYGSEKRRHKKKRRVTPKTRERVKVVL